jgi:circadian clock protein KaiB
VPDSEENHRFVLYVTSNSSRSQRAAENLRGVCAAALGDRFQIEVVDVLEQPEAAESALVIATPTVMRLFPPPIRRVIGDLSDFALAASALGLVGPETSPRLGAAR